MSAFNQLGSLLPSAFGVVPTPGWPAASSSHRNSSHLAGAKNSEKRNSDNEQLMAQLMAQPDLSMAIALAQRFARLIRHRQSEHLDTWLEQASDNPLTPFQRFEGLREDYDAVKAAMMLPVSNGPVEGQINRLKMLKRQMYGRVGMELLQRRFLFAS